jgi:hypothetical protein
LALVGQGGTGHGSGTGTSTPGIGGRGHDNDNDGGTHGFGVGTSTKPIIHNGTMGTTTHPYIKHTPKPAPKGGHKGRGN